MNIEKTQHENFFKFTVYQDNLVIVERIFLADYFNPVIRYSVDIREMIPYIISKLQKVLSKRYLTYSYNLGINNKPYDLLKIYKEGLRLYKKPVENKLENPEIIVQNINNKIIKGIECKFGLYINENKIVERNFYVNNYTPTVRFSIDIVETVNEIVFDIFANLKEMDVKHMWEDYDLIHTYNLFIHQIRELNQEERERHLKNMWNSSYVKKVKLHYKQLFQQQNMLKNNIIQVKEK